MIILSTTDLSLRFGTTTVLENISFSINEGDRLGIIGVNGAGKTSLFRLITGEYTPDSGAVYVSKGKTIGLWAQNADMTDEVGGEPFPLCWQPKSGLPSWRMHSQSAQT